MFLLQNSGTKHEQQLKIEPSGIWSRDKIACVGVWIISESFQNLIAIACLLSANVQAFNSNCVG